MERLFDELKIIAIMHDDNNMDDHALRLISNQQFCNNGAQSEQNSSALM